MGGKMKAAQISRAGGDWELVERDIPEPGAGQVRVKVDACGICHSDVLVKEGLWPGLQFPRVPGHEVAGRIDAMGDHVHVWTKGQRVGVGWHGGHDFVCEQCRRGDFAMCVNRKVTGFDFDGGYAEYLIVPASALAAIRMKFRLQKLGHSCALVSLSTTRYAIPVRAPATLWRCTALAAWAISAFSMRDEWDLRLLPSIVVTTKNLWHWSWARISTSMRRLAT